MELSSQESIQALIRTQGLVTHVRDRRAGQDAARPTNRSRRMVCKCGQCRQCLENERWERIFTKKFADPDYYASRLVHYTSPLTSL
ncbi:MAG: hypothetical protein ABSH56_29210 [Bryobacteraceae bacterium]|jgi:hypothetical protein